MWSDTRNFNLLAVNKVTVLVENKIQTDWPWYRGYSGSIFRGRKLGLKPGLWMRIHFMRIRIQHFSE